MASSPGAGLWLALLVPLQAAPSIAAEDTFLSCRKIEDGAERLACYDRVVDGIRTDKAPEIPVAGSRASPSAAPDDRFASESMFGRSAAESAQELQKSYGAQPPRALTAKVSAVATSGGRVLVTLENGQVWRQAETLTFLIRAGDSADIESGALGAYYLRRNGKGKSIRVVRIQ